MIRRFESVFLSIVLTLGMCSCGQNVLTEWQEQYDLGVRYLSEGNYEEAIIIFTAAIDIDAKGALAYLGRAQAQMSYANKIFPETEDVNNWSKEKIGLYNLAEADYQNAIALECTLIDAYTGLCNLYVSQKRWNEAQEILAIGLKNNKDNSILQQKTEEILLVKKENTENVLRQIDHAILLSGYQLQGALKHFVISDADQDGLDELFISCRSNRYQDISSDVILTFDEKDGKPYCLSTVLLSASGTRGLVYSTQEKRPIIGDSFSSMVIGRSEVYHFWDGSNWKKEIVYQSELDFEAMHSGEDLVYKTPVIDFWGKSISPEEYQANIQQMDLQPPPNRVESAESYLVGQVKMADISDLLTQHLAAFYPDNYSHLSFDIDSDGDQEELWAVTGVTDYWYANDPQYQQTNEVMGVPEISGTALIIADEVSGMVSLSFGITQDITTVSLQKNNGLFLLDRQGKSYHFCEINSITRELILTEAGDHAWDLLFNSDWYLLDSSGYYAYCYHFGDAMVGTVDTINLETNELIPELSGEPMEFEFNHTDKKIIVVMGGAKIVYQYLPEHEYGAMLLQSRDESEFAGEIRRVLWSFPENMSPAEIRESLYERERLMMGQ